MYFDLDRRGIVDKDVNLSTTLCNYLSFDKMEDLVVAFLINTFKNKLTTNLKGAQW